MTERCVHAHPVCVRSRALLSIKWVRLPRATSVQALILERLESDTSALAAIVAYTHDLVHPESESRGNLYYEMNSALRDRSSAGRATMMRTWGVAVHYTLKVHYTLRVVIALSSQDCQLRC